MKCMVALLLGLCLLGCHSSNSAPSVEPSVTQQAQQARAPHSYQVIINHHTIAVEVVTRDEDKQKGLSGRTHLPQGHGMLFLFEEEQLLGFWMKDTLIPLDILYFDQMGRLVQAYYNVAPCQEDPCLAYPSVFPAKYVLEVNAGEAQGWGLTMGDSMTFARD